MKILTRKYAKSRRNADRRRAGGRTVVLEGAHLRTHENVLEPVEWSACREQPKCAVNPYSYRYYGYFANGCTRMWQRKGPGCITMSHVIVGAAGIVCRGAGGMIDHCVSRGLRGWRARTRANHTRCYTRITHASQQMLAGHCRNGTTNAIVHQQLEESDGSLTDLAHGL